MCGITPYDATHLGHAATYVTFDVLQRAWRDAGLQVTYVQNVTDVDEPLLERAERDGIDWRELASREIGLFFEDMEALRVLPPDHYVGAVEGIPDDVSAVERLLAAGTAYRLAVPDGEPVGEGATGEDVYLDLATQPSFGAVSGWSRAEMMEVFADRGATLTGRASGTRWTRCSGAPDARGSRTGTAPRSARDARAGTSSAPRSPSATSAPPSTCRAAAPTWSSRTTR